MNSYGDLTDLSIFPKLEEYLHQVPNENIADLESQWLR